ncbi:hypothetical protein [Desulfonema magnum]|uniref:Nucleotide exchange factor GrpE n=1 Tax=Desulfonema magnum TaxID=45655 RepID=A0A975GUH0_9BACT|nr:hypothetical protein [Desulfonema magnum]QTA93028.1 Uncharacterized protein dnm_091230 [Desulfonema magnum]
MKKNITIISFLLLMIIFLLIDRKLFQTEILKLTETISSLEKSVAVLRNTILEQNQRIKVIQGMLRKKEVRQTDNFQHDLLLYGIFSVLALLSAMIIVLLMLKKKLGFILDILCEKIHQTENTLISQIIKSASELTGLIGPSDHSPPSEFPVSTDHTLALRVGQEIHRMRKRTEHMPEHTKGLTALKNSLKRLEQAFNDKGYELTELLGKPFAEGMTIHARFVPSDEFGPGEQIITKVIKPQISFNGVLIQSAEVEVSIGE